MANEDALPISYPSSSAGAKILKRSIAIAGHRTSVSLEETFWRELKSMAERRDLSIAALVAEIDAGRQGANLSSAIRVFVLEALIARQ
jgi:predicted DNA-binding ribbon-helix-helix protein